MLLELYLILVMAGITFYIVLPSKDEIEEHKGYWIFLYGRSVLVVIATIALIVLSVLDLFRR